MEFCALGSGSAGNCSYLRSGGTAVLIDFGLSKLQAFARMAAVGIDPSGIQAVLVTHNHTDHFKGLERFSKCFPSIPILANENTASCIDRDCPDAKFNWEIFETASAFPVGGFQVEAFSVPHDAADTVGFVITDGTSRFAIATDLGSATTLVRQKLSGCDAIAIESNHDHEMLMQSDRAWKLKSRIQGPSGHLSNVDAAELIRSVLSPRLRSVFLAHLSHECNTPALALNTMKAALRAAGRADILIGILEQAAPSKLFTL